MNTALMATRNVRSDNGDGPDKYILAKVGSSDYLGFGSEVIGTLGDTAIVACSQYDATWQLQRLGSGMQTASYDIYTHLSDALVAAAEVYNYDVSQALRRAAAAARAREDYGA